MAIDDRSLAPSEVVSLSKPASSSCWSRFKNWTAGQWAAIRPGPEARRGAVWGTLTAAAITVILGVNARVWYPDGPGPFPLALIVHGNHKMAEFSDPGYAISGNCSPAAASFSPPSTKTF